MQRRLDSAQEAVKDILGFYDDLQNQFEKFAGFSINKASLAAYHEAVFPTPKKEDQPI